MDFIQKIAAPNFTFIFKQALNSTNIMPNIRKRIEFSKVRIYQQELRPENTDENGDKNDEEGKDFSECEIKFEIKGENLNGHGPQIAATVTDENGESHPAMGGWPEVEVAFTVSESDIPRVNAWFDDNYQGVTEPESALLQKNRTAAVLNALKSYFNSAVSSNLFTSPFRIGWHYRFTDGSLSTFHDSGILACFHSAPRLLIVRRQLSDKHLHTRAQVRNIPGRLHYQLQPASDFKEIRDRLKAIEIYITKPVELYPPNGEVAGIRSVTIDGSPHRCWHYDRYSESDVALRVSQDTDFRRIGSISINEIGDNNNYIAVPIAAGALADFSKLPKPDSTTGGNPSMAGKTIRILTEPLHLDYKEDEKSVRAVTLRGVFQRDKVKFRLYASQHRENRHLIASVTGPYIRGIYGNRWRWFEIEIEAQMREGDFFEAATFEFNVS